MQRLTSQTSTTETCDAATCSLIPAETRLVQDGMKPVADAATFSALVVDVGMLLSTHNFAASGSESASCGLQAIAVSTDAAGSSAGSDGLPGSLLGPLLVNADHITPPWRRVLASGGGPRVCDLVDEDEDDCNASSPASTEDGDAPGNPRGDAQRQGGSKRHSTSGYISAGPGISWRRRPGQRMCQLLPPVAPEAAAGRSYVSVPFVVEVSHGVPSAGQPAPVRRHPTAVLQGGGSASASASSGGAVGRRSLSRLSHRSKTQLFSIPEDWEAEWHQPVGGAGQGRAGLNPSTRIFLQLGARTAEARDGDAEHTPRVLGPVQAPGSPLGIGIGTGTGIGIGTGAACVHNGRTSSDCGSGSSSALSPASTTRCSSRCSMSWSGVSVACGAGSSSSGGGGWTGGSKGHSLSGHGYGYSTRVVDVGEAVGGCVVAHGSVTEDSDAQDVMGRSLSAPAARRHRSLGAVGRRARTDRTGMASRSRLSKSTSGAHAAPTLARVLECTSGGGPTAPRQKSGSGSNGGFGPVGPIGASSQGPMQGGERPHSHHGIAAAAAAAATPPALTSRLGELDGGGAVSAAPPAAAAAAASPVPASGRHRPRRALSHLLTHLGMGACFRGPRDTEPDAACEPSGISCPSVAGTTAASHTGGLDRPSSAPSVLIGPATAPEGGAEQQSAERGLSGTAMQAATNPRLTAASPPQGLVSPPSLNQAYSLPPPPPALVAMLRRSGVPRRDLLLCSEALALGAQLGVLMGRAAARGEVSGGEARGQGAPLFQRAMAAARAVSHHPLRALAQEVVWRYADPRRGNVEEAIRALLKEASGVRA